MAIQECIFIIICMYVALFTIITLKKCFRSSKTLKIAFFHPFWQLNCQSSNDGGGGQRVLWCIVKGIQESNYNYEIAIYSLESNIDTILNNVKQKFDIHIIKDNRLKIILVEGRKYLMPKSFLTMVFHILLPWIYTIKCLWKYQPDIFYDTTGFAFNFFVVKLLLPFTKCYAYVHYPFISRDMIKKIEEGRSDFNNQQRISKSKILSKLKIFYYKIIFYIYKSVKVTVYFAQTNSTWTYNHMKQIWGEGNNLVKLYPPCSVTKLLKVQKPKHDKIIIMSLAQFRPQKNQLLQLQILHQLLGRMQSIQNKRQIVLRICGTTRGSDDQKILQQLKYKAKELNIQKNVEFRVNMDFKDVLICRSEATIGIHTMEAEHFGISIVEMMAAGILVVAHCSAGPKYDIIKNEDYLAITKQDYVDKIWRLITMPSQKMEILSSQMRQKAKEFSDQTFQERFMEELQNSFKK